MQMHDLVLIHSSHDWLGTLLLNDDELGVRQLLGHGYLLHIPDRSRLKSQRHHRVPEHHTPTRSSRGLSIRQEP